MPAYLSLQLKAKEFKAYVLLALFVVVILPEVGVSSFINDINPMRMVDTDQLGFQSSGWKSLMLRHSRVLSWNLPLGVYIITEGGL
jgi:hypothetical protein